MKIKRKSPRRWPLLLLFFVPALLFAIAAVQFTTQPKLLEVTGEPSSYGGNEYWMVIGEAKKLISMPRDKISVDQIAAVSEMIREYRMRLDLERSAAFISGGKGHRIDDLVSQLSRLEEHLAELMTELSSEPARRKRM